MQENNHQQLTQAALDQIETVPKKLTVSWEEYHHIINRLAQIIYQSNWSFDATLCLARGGLRIGDQLSRIYQTPLAILSVSSYREASGMQVGELLIGQSITMAYGELQGRILLIDDLVDSGDTLNAVKAYLYQHHPKVREVRTAVLWYKACSLMQPDYYVQYLPDNPWIEQPFEIYDRIRPNELPLK